MRETTRATPPLQEVPAVSEEHSEEESTENPSGTASAQDDDPKERAVAQTARFNAVLDTFHAQPVDRAWSSRTSARIEGLLGPRLAKVPHGDVECRSTWCSLELTPPAGTDNRAVLQTVMFASSELEDKPRLMMYACPRDDGTLAYRYYFGYERH
jgi:hypothetical protein